MIHRIDHQLVMILFSVAGMLSSCCDQTVQSEVVSPSTEKSASVTVVNCGAFMNYVTNVNVRGSTAPFSAQDGLVVSIGEKVFILLEWRDDHTLIVYLPKSAIGHDFVDNPIRVQNSEVNQVHIEYR